jgi:hypothetical protein
VQLRASLTAPHHQVPLRGLGRDPVKVAVLQAAAEGDVAQQDHPDVVV